MPLELKLIGQDSQFCGRKTFPIKIISRSQKNYHKSNYIQTQSFYSFYANIIFFGLNFPNFYLNIIVFITRSFLCLICLILFLLIGGVNSSWNPIQPVKTRILFEISKFKKSLLQIHARNFNIS